MEKRAEWDGGGGKFNVHRLERGSFWPERKGVLDEGEKKLTVVVV